MMFFARIFLVLFCSPIGFYLFRVVRSALGLFIKDKKRLVFWLSLGTAVAATAPLFWFFNGASFWGLFLLHFLAFSLVCSLFGLAVRRIKKEKTKRVCTAVLRLQIIPLFATVALLSYGYYNMTNLQMTKYRVEADIKREVTVAVISDIHYGAVADAAYVREAVDKMNRQQPDIVVLCGDIVDESTENDELYEVFEILGGIEAEGGVYYVYGNHDFSHYSDNPEYTESELRAAVDKAGIVMLEDETVRPLDGVVLAGRKDAADERLPMAQLLSDVKTDEYVIVADHQPVDFAEKAAAGADMQISGHTHGGQIFPVGCISTFISSNEMNYGIKQVDGMTAIVSSGAAGWSFPMRTQGKSEYVIVEIVPE